MSKVTPLMAQYFKLKAKHPDAILLYRVGDFYETFAQDAITVADILGIVLTKRNNGGDDIELAGFPYHSLDVYLPKLVRAGYRVAICEQLEKPSKEKKIVDRGVTDVVTPGVTIDDTILDRKSNNYLAAIHFTPKNEFGVAFLDISTGEFLVSEGNACHYRKID
jgi:DNA mismatch repair protein MutS